MFELVFRRRFAMAHRLLSGGSEQCPLPHGHTETVTVRLRATRPAPLDGEANMVEPFERAKSRWHHWIDGPVDHALQLSDADPLLDWFHAHEPHRLTRILVTPGDPTTEMLACHSAAKLGAFLAEDGGRLACTDLGIEETPANTVAFAVDPLEMLPMREGWWRRANMSINDLDLPA
jgi:6-pyruvoyltetrahydropterin/6-carboxytetrahydropterin synthase